MQIQSIIYQLVQYQKRTAKNFDLKVQQLKSKRVLLKARIIIRGKYKIKIQLKFFQLQSSVSCQNKVLKFKFKHVLNIYMKQTKNQRKRKPVDHFLTPNQSKKLEKAVDDEKSTIELRDLSPHPFYQSTKTLQQTVTYQFVETPFQRKQFDNLQGFISKILNFEHLSQQKPLSDCQSENEQSQISQQSYLLSEIQSEQKQVISQQIQRIPKQKEQLLVPQKIIRQLPTIAEVKTATCNCKKTKCLKLYCDCFRDNKMCGQGCNCVGCHNNDQHQQQRNTAIIVLLDRDPQGFKPKIQKEQHSKGCNCKKSNCLKKYCQCYQAGLSCGHLCKCEDCKNKQEKKVQEIQKKQKNIAKKQIKYIQKKVQ